MSQFFMGSDEPQFGWFGSHIGHFLSHAVSSAGKEIGHVTHATMGLVGKIPIVGAPVHTVFSAVYHATMAPLSNTVNAVIHGKNIGKAALDTLHAEVQSVKDVAPYAQMVVGLVPGIGTGVSAALGAGLALANGQRIDKALMAGAIEALPGGALAHAAASAAVASVQAAASGHPIDVKSAAGTLLNSLPIPPAAKASLAAGAHAAGTLASGKQVQVPSIQQALAALPPAARKAYQAGLALGTASIVQGHKIAELDSAAVRNKLAEAGITISKSVPALGEARKLAGAGVKGFDLGLGLLGQRATLFDIQHVRQSLTGADATGFDLAASVKIGLVSHPVSATLSPAAQAGHAIALGAQGMADQHAVASLVGKNPSAVVGANSAASKIAIQKEPWYFRMAHALGFKLGHKHS